MKFVLSALLSLLVLARPGRAQFNVDDAHKFAWGENVGWSNWRDANVASMVPRLEIRADALLSRSQ